MKLDPGQIIYNRYEIDEVLGKGGMAVVYRALDQKLGRYVTLKVLKEEYSADEEYVRRFPVEAQAAAALNHPNIAQIFDSAQDGDICFIVLEYIDGTNLKTLINRKAPFDNDTTLAVAIQIAEGLAEAHSYGIVHRDVKPQNILVTPTSSVKVTDFGIARVAKASTLTGGGGSMGSVHYFSPEQARGGFVDNKSDIYALGITLFEMATGTLPYDGDSTVAVALKHINDPLPDMVALNPGISESLEKIIIKATEKSPVKRYQSMEEMTADLKRALSDASGSFVENEDTENAPTRVISTGDRDEVKYRKDTNAEAYDDEYDDAYDDEYEDDYADDEEEEIYTDKKEDRKVMLFGILLALPIILLITIGSFGIYRWLRNDWVTLIDLTGMTQSAAEAWAEDAGVDLILNPEYNDDIALGLLFGQMKTPDYRTMRPGDALHVSISLGPEPYLQMIVVAGRNLTYADARAALLEAFPDIEFEIQQELYEDETIPRDVVMGQDPAPGEPLRDGYIVTLFVSAGPDMQQVVVPNFIQRTEIEAHAIALEAGLILGVPERRENATFAAGTIFAQSLEPDELVDRNSIIIITISTGTPTPPDPTPTPTPTPTPEPTPTPTPGDEDTDNGDETDDNGEISYYTPGYEDDPNGDPDAPPPPPREGSITIQLPYIVSTRPEPYHLVIWLAVGGGEPIPLFNDRNAMAWRFPLVLRTQDMEGRLAQPLTGDGSELFIIQWLDEEESIISTSEMIFRFND